MILRRCESPGDTARIAPLSADQAPTAIIGCPHMAEPSEYIQHMSIGIHDRGERVIVIMQ